MSGFWQQIEEHIRRVMWGRTGAESEALARKELEERTARWLERQKRALDVPSSFYEQPTAKAPKSLPESEQARPVGRVEF